MEVFPHQLRCGGPLVTPIYHDNWLNGGVHTVFPLQVRVLIESILLQFMEKVNASHCKN
jgi:hypothetical protein